MGRSAIIILKQSRFCQNTRWATPLTPLTSWVEGSLVSLKEKSGKIEKNKGGQSFKAINSVN